MSTDQLEKFIEDVIAFLKSLDKLVPGRVDEDLISYLESLKHPWTLEKLQRDLPQAQAQSKK